MKDDDRGGFPLSEVSLSKYYTIFQIMRGEDDGTTECIKINLVWLNLVG